jgi:hypothetical protein
MPFASKRSDVLRSFLSNNPTAGTETRPPQSIEPKRGSGKPAQSSQPPLPPTPRSPPLTFCPSLDRRRLPHGADAIDPFWLGERVVGWLGGYSSQER